MKALVEIDIFLTPDGVPTCATDFVNGEICPFYATKKWGIQELCLMGPRNVPERLWRAESKNKDFERGYLIVPEWCWIRKNQKEQKCHLKKKSSEKSST